jgi:hypothetical protein
MGAVRLRVPQRVISLSFDEPMDELEFFHDLGGERERVKVWKAQRPIDLVEGYGQSNPFLHAGVDLKRLERREAELSRGF